MQSCHPTDMPPPLDMRTQQSQEWPGLFGQTLVGESQGHGQSKPSGVDAGEPWWDSTQDPESTAEPLIGDGSGSKFGQTKRVTAHLCTPVTLQFKLWLKFQICVRFVAWESKSWIQPRTQKILKTMHHWAVCCRRLGKYSPKTGETSDFSSVLSSPSSLGWNSWPAPE